MIVVRGFLGVAVFVPVIVVVLMRMVSVIVIVTARRGRTSPRERCRGREKR